MLLNYADQNPGVNTFKVWKVESLKIFVMLRNKANVSLNERTIGNNNFTAKPGLAKHRLQDAVSVESHSPATGYRAQYQWGHLHLPQAIKIFI